MRSREAATVRETPAAHRGRAPQLVTVIIPIRNMAASLERQLEALAAQDYGGAWEVVVADNGSTDDLRSAVRRWSDRLPGLRIVPATGPPGSNTARNAGMRAATGDYLCFCDADDVVAPGWLEAMARAGTRSDVVGGRLEDHLNEPDERAWRFPYDPDRLPVALGFLPYVFSGNLGVWKEAAMRLGGWSQDFRQGGDADFSWRAHLRGLRVGYAPDAVVRYRYRSSAASLAKQVYRYGRGEVLLYKRFREAGAPRTKLRNALRTWAWIVLKSFYAFRSPRHRGIWVRRAAYRMGRIAGSIRHRVVYL